MGFFKRLFSISGRAKAKRRQKDVQRQPLSRVPLEEEQAEATIHRMLRNNASRYEVIAQTDYLSPPSTATHQDTLSPYSTPAGTLNSHITRSPSPTLSFVSAAPSAAPSGTYSVTVRERTVHTPATLGPPTAASSLSSKRTLAHTNCGQHGGTPPKRAKRSHEPEEVTHEGDLSVTPSERSGFYKLRRDSSVNTLLNIYDKHGCIDVGSFQSPEKIGRPQTKRSGSTLRKLLGVSEPGDGITAAQEGDISWAERILGEGRLDASSHLSSTSLEAATQTNRDSIADATADTARDTSLTFPSVSSMVVELSMASDGVPPWCDTDAPSTLPSPATVAPAPTPDRSVADRTAEESPIKPAAEVFAFLLSPRKPKSSNATLDPSMLSGRASPTPPPVPPKSSYARELSMLPIRIGASGIPRHPYFATSPARPAASQAGRNRSHSASAADVLGRSGAPIYRRSGTVATPSRIPRVSGDAARPMSRAETDEMRPSSPVEGKRPATALGFDETFGVISIDTEFEDEAPSPPPRTPSRIPTLWGAGTSKSRPVSGVVRASSVGPSTALWSDAPPKERPMNGVVRAASVGASTALGPTPSKSSNRPPSGVVRASSVGPSASLSSTSTHLCEKPSSSVTRASSGGPTTGLNFAPKSNRASAHAHRSSVGPCNGLDLPPPTPNADRASRHVRASSVGASSALIFGTPAPAQHNRPSMHRRSSSLASSSPSTSVLTDAPELAEMQRVVKVGLGARALALRPETRRLPAAPSAYCAEDKENDGLMPSAVLRAVSPGVVGKTASGALDELPVTPVRARAALRSLSAEDEPPSPTTSTELSPLGQELMANVREQRMRAREREKVEGRRRHEGGRARSKTPVLA